MPLYIVMKKKGITMDCMVTFPNRKATFVEEEGPIHNGFGLLSPALNWAGLGAGLCGLDPVYQVIIF